VCACACVRACARARAGTGYHLHLSKGQGSLMWIFSTNYIQFSLSCFNFHNLLHQFKSLDSKQKFFVIHWKHKEEFTEGNKTDIQTWDAELSKDSASFLLPELPPAATMRAVFAARELNCCSCCALSLKFCSLPGVPKMWQIHKLAGLLPQYFPCYEQDFLFKNAS
jgi:hypothetical protein